MQAITVAPAAYETVTRMPSLLAANTPLSFHATGRKPVGLERFDVRVAVGALGEDVDKAALRGGGGDAVKRADGEFGQFRREFRRFIGFLDIFGIALRHLEGHILGNLVRERRDTEGARSL